MIVNVPDVTADSATVQTIDVGQVRVGPVSVGELVVNNTDASATGASGVLRGVSVQISIEVSLSWRVNVGGHFGIDESDTYSWIFRFTVNVGDVTLPALNNIRLSIPDVTGQNMSADIVPMPLAL